LHDLQDRLCPTLSEPQRTRELMALGAAHARNFAARGDWAARGIEFVSMRSGPRAIASSAQVLEFDCPPDERRMRLRAPRLDRTVSGSIPVRLRGVRWHARSASGSFVRCPCRDL
jgi:hypothetical protein